MRERRGGGETGGVDKGSGSGGGWRTSKRRRERDREGDREKARQGEGEKGSEIERGGEREKGGLEHGLKLQLQSSGNKQTFSTNQRREREQTTGRLQTTLMMAGVNTRRMHVGQRKALK